MNTKPNPYMRIPNINNRKCKWYYRDKDKHILVHEAGLQVAYSFLFGDNFAIYIPKSYALEKIPIEKAIYKDDFIEIDIEYRDLLLTYI